MHRNTTSYGLGHTETFRRNSESITLDFIQKIDVGTNLQNIEKSARKMYVPDDGKIFVQCDQSGADALIVSYLCRDGNFRSLFKNGISPHVFVAIHVFGNVWQQKMDSGSSRYFSIKEVQDYPIPELTKHPFWKELVTLIKSSDNWPSSQRYYYISKQLGHSGNYDASWAMFQLNTLEKSKGKIVIPDDDAKHFHTHYHELFPEIHEWHDETKAILTETRTLHNLFGFPRYFGRELNNKMFKEAYAYVPQSTVAIITAVAYTRLQEFIEANKLKWDLLSDCHDSYLCQCPIDEEKECRAKMLEFMQQPLIGRDGVKFNMRAEAQSGFNWSPYHPDKNPKGMK